jgi:hypothetical protein
MGGSREVEGHRGRRPGRGPEEGRERGLGNKEMKAGEGRTKINRR